jgi:CHAT domain-containing protein
LLLVCSLPILNFSLLLFTSSPGVAQSISNRKAEADLRLQMGIRKIESREPEAALPQLEQALRIYRELKDPQGEGTALANLGRAHFAFESYTKAIAYSEQSLAIARAIKDQSLEVEALKRLGLIYLRTRNHPKSIFYVEQTLAIHRKKNNRVEEARSLGDLGFVYLQAGNFAKAIEMQERSVQLAVQLKDDSLIFEARGNLEETYSDLRGGAHSLFQQGIQQNQSNQFTAAIQSWEKALQIYRILQDQNREEDVLKALGNAYYRIGNYAKAREAQEQLLAIVRKRGDAAQTLEDPLRSSLGYTQQQLGDYSQAIAQMEQRLATARANNNFMEMAAALDSLGHMYSTLGSYAKAIENHEKSLAIVEKDGDRLRRAAVLSYLGNAYYNLGNYGKAISYLKQGLPTHQGPKLPQAHMMHASMLGFLGDAYAKLSDYTTAINYHEQRLAICRSINYQQGEANTLARLGNIYSTLGKQTKAIEYGEQSLAIYRTVNDEAGESGALSGLGGIYEVFGNYSKAIEYYQKSLTISQKIQSKPREIIAFANIASVLQKQNQPELAIVFYKQSINVSEAIRRDVRLLDRDLQATYTESVADNYRKLADLLLQQNRIIEAMQVLDLLKVQDLQDFLKDSQGKEVTQKGVNLLPEETAIVRALQTAAQPLQTVVSSANIQTQVQSLQKTAANQNLKLNTYQDLQSRIQKLGKNSALFYPLILDDRLELVVLTKDRPPIRKPVAITQKQLETEIEAFRKQLQGRSPLIKQPAQQLYQRLIQPIAAELKTAGVDTLVYAPDSIMRYVPLAALHDGNQWLAERYQINYLTALALTPLEPDKNSDPRVLAGALTEKSQVTILGKTYDFPALQFTQPEVENLAKLLPNTTTLIDKTFNRDRLSKGTSQSTILHLATHGMFVPDSPDQSIIVLGDGTSISLREIEQQWKFPNVSLVVLSACETAIGGKLGSGIEILGFGYQMQRTGSRASISSLWTVDDGGTQGFMNTFYTALKQGKTPAAAIQQTQQDFISGRVTSQDVQQLRASGGRYVEGGIPIDLTHPFYWAPFILIGNGL